METGRWVGIGRNLTVSLKRMNELGFAIAIDYGKGRLVEKLRGELPNTVQVMGYDPAVEEWNQSQTICRHINITRCP